MLLACCRVPASVCECATVWDTMLDKVVCSNRNSNIL